MKMFFSAVDVYILSRQRAAPNVHITQFNRLLVEVFSAKVVSATSSESFLVWI